MADGLPPLGELFAHGDDEVATCTCYGTVVGNPHVVTNQVTLGFICADCGGPVLFTTDLAGAIAGLTEMRRIFAAETGQRPPATEREQDWARHGPPYGPDYEPGRCSVCHRVAGMPSAPCRYCTDYVYRAP